MGNSSDKPHADTFLELSCGNSSSPKENHFTTFKYMVSNIPRSTLQNIKNSRGEGVMTCCCYNPDIEYVKHLISSKFKPTKDLGGNNPLHACALLNNIEAIKVIGGVWPELASEKNGNGKTPMEMTSNQDVLNELLSVIDNSSDPSAKYYSMIKPELRHAFIHIDKFKNKVQANFAGGQSIIYLADMVTTKGEIRVVLKGTLARAKNDASIMREMKVLQHVLKIYTPSKRTSSSQPGNSVNSSTSSSTPIADDGIIRSPISNLNLAHPNIIQMIGLTIEDKTVYLVSPYTPLGDLHKWVISNESMYSTVGDNGNVNCEFEFSDGAICGDLLPKDFSYRIVTNKRFQKKLIGYITQISKGLQFLHDNGIIHNDIKPMNCLLFSEGKRTVIKLIDFGLSIIENDPDFLNTPFNCRATIPYVAPERLALKSIFSNPPSIKTDMFSFGALVWNLFIGKRPFYYIPNRVTSCKLPHLPENTYLGKTIACFVNKCISNVPSERPLNFYSIIYNTPVMESSNNEYASGSGRLRSREVFDIDFSESSTRHTSEISAVSGSITRSSSSDISCISTDGCETSPISRTHIPEFTINTPSMLCPPSFVLGKSPHGNGNTCNIASHYQIPSPDFSTRFTAMTIEECVVVVYVSMKVQVQVLTLGYMVECAMEIVKKNILWKNFHIT